MCMYVTDDLGKWMTLEYLEIYNVQSIVKVINVSSGTTLSRKADFPAFIFWVFCRH